MAWLTGYTYRKKITITGQAGAGTNYQVKLQIGNTLGGDFNLGGHSLSFPNDIRFMNSTSSTQLDYWIEDIAASPITVWVEVVDSLNNNVDIYCYYGKAGDTTTSNGTNTFIQWHGAATSNFLDSAITTYPYIYQGKVKRTSNVTSSAPYGAEFGVADTITFEAGNKVVSYNYIDVYTTNKYMFQAFNNGITTGWTPYQIPAIPLDTWVNIKITHISTSSAILSATGYSDMTLSTLPATSMGLTMVNMNGGGTSAQEYSFIRKYAVTEPTFSISGTEELGVTAISMAITQSETPCRTGICTIRADITWQNLGSSSVTFRPKILIDGVTYVQYGSDITIGPYPAISSTIQITTPTLAVGTHGICPYPN